VKANTIAPPGFTGVGVGVGVGAGVGVGVGVGVGDVPPVILKLASDISKKIFPIASTLTRAVEV
jgi:hypothetical protein